MCGKCGDSWHVIAAMASGRITKVQCKVCLGSHRYKTPEGEQRVDGPAVRRRIASRGGRAEPKRAAGGPALDPDLSRPVRNYAMSETYEPGDRIDHPKFGHGVVEVTSQPGKMMVHFPSGRRTLAHGRARS